MRKRRALWARRRLAGRLMAQPFLVAVHHEHNHEQRQVGQCEPNAKPPPEGTIVVVSHKCRHDGHEQYWREKYNKSFEHKGIITVQPKAKVGRNCYPRWSTVVSISYSGMQDKGGRRATEGVWATHAWPWFRQLGTTWLQKAPQKPRQRAGGCPAHTSARTTGRDSLRCSP